MLFLGIILLALVSTSTSTETCKNPKSSEKCANLSGLDNKNFNQDTDWEKATSIYQFHAKDIMGKDVSLDKYKGHVLIVVNVASNCGLTAKNYEQLEALYEEYRDSKGLRILAFPSNQFGGQEPGSSAEILKFVKTKFNVQFDMFEKIDVNGGNAHPLWKWLKKNGPGLITDEIKWNFTKFIIDKNGQVVDRSAPTTEPFELKNTLNKYF